MSAPRQKPFDAAGASVETPGGQCLHAYTTQLLGDYFLGRPLALVSLPLLPGVELYTRSAPRSPARLEFPVNGEPGCWAHHTADDAMLVAAFCCRNDRPEQKNNVCYRF